MSEQPRIFNGPADDAFWEALARYQAGESTAEEAEAIRQHLSTNPEDAALLALIDAQLAEPAERATNIDVESALASMHRQMDSEQLSTKPKLELSSNPAPRVAHPAADRTLNASRVASSVAPRSRHIWRNSGLAAAAVVIIAIGLSRTSREPDVAQASYTTSLHAFATDVGKQQDLTLIDGTKVQLAPGSRLTLETDYNRSHRNVQLIGAAHFTVAHGGSIPFIVHTAAATVRDIGTAFTVKTDTRGGAVVVVTQGVVEVTKPGGSAAIRMTAGDRSVISAASSLTRSHVDSAVLGALDIIGTSGRLVYRDATIAEVASDLRRWYGLDMEVDSAFTSRTLNAELPTSDVEQALRIVGLALGAEIDRTDGKAVVRQTRTKGTR